MATGAACYAGAMSDAPADDRTLALAAARLREARARLARAEDEHDAATGHEKAETYGPVAHWTAEVAAARAAWRALAGPDEPEPR